MTQAAAATSDAQDAAKRRAGTTAEKRSLPPRVLLERKVAAARSLRGTIRFLEKRRVLQATGEQLAVGQQAFRRASKRLARVRREIAYYERLVDRRQARRLAKAPPTAAIRAVFGRFASEAIKIAWCESRLVTTARNGQYLGLFQMGSHERGLFGHGSSAHAQARAAHRYFVRSGRDWSPWSCRWAAY